MIFKEICSILCGFESSYCTEDSFRVSIRLDTMTEHFGRCPWIIIKSNEADDSCGVKFERVNTFVIFNQLKLDFSEYLNICVFMSFWINPLNCKMILWEFPMFLPFRMPINDYIVNWICLSVITCTLLNTSQATLSKPSKRYECLAKCHFQTFFHWNCGCVLYCAVDSIY